MTADLAFVLVAERGVLEWQALLLVDSIRRWGGRLRTAPVYVVSPRADRQPRRSVRAELRRMGAECINGARNPDPSGYGTANRIVAGAHVERTSGHEVLVVLDSDTLFLREPSALVLASDVDAAARPVDQVGICSTGVDDPRDAYWRDLCAVAGVDRNAIPTTRTTVDAARVTANYNGGLLAVRREVGLLDRLETTFFAALAAGLRPRRGAGPLRSGVGMVPSNVAELWGSAQAALSVTMWGRTRRVRELPPTYNVPLHLLAELPEDAFAASFPSAVHVHYHWLFEPGEPPDPLRSRPDSPLTVEQRAWLDEWLAR